MKTAQEIKKVTVEANTYRAVVMGGSAGGMDALGRILTRLPKDFPLPIVIVLHVLGDQPSLLSEIMGAKTELRVKEVEEKEQIEAGTIYFASPGYHLLIERDQSFSLSTEAPVNFSRPSIDLLFETASDAFTTHLVGVLLSGANQDGAKGLQRIQEAGGLALVQDPASSQIRTMPDAGIAALGANGTQILSPEGIAQFLLNIGRGGQS
jgi:two-component system chemotaxis response regulator CheB